MSENLRSVIPVLAFVAKFPSKHTQKRMLKYLSKKEKFRKAIKELAVNLLKGNIKIDLERTKRKVRKHKVNIYEISKSKNPKYIVQSGGWLQWIIPIASALLEVAL